AAQVIAEKGHLTDLAASADSAYVHGMSLVLLVCGIAALASALLAAAFLPGTAQVDRSDAVKGAAEDAGPGLVTPAADARQ
ncbi:MFS transporter, partial [Streptomyces sp. NPDC054962]